MSKDLRPTFDVTFTKSDDTKSDGSAVTTIALKQVEDTQCDDIEFILYNKKSLQVNMDCTIGSYNPLGKYYEDVDEPVIISGGKSVGVSTPGVVHVYSMKVVGSVLTLQDSALVPTSAGHLLFDMETEEVKWTGKNDIFCVVRIKYKSLGSKFKFNWPFDDSIVEALIAAVASDGNKSSLTLSRADCKDNEDNSKKYGDFSSENTNLVLDLKMNISWTVMHDLEMGPSSVYSLLFLYPVYATGKPELRVVFGREGKLVECMFTEQGGFPAMREISESINFSNSAIANLGNFVGSFSEFTVAAESAFFDSKNNRILIPTFRGPGESVDVDEWVDTEATYTDPATGSTKKYNVRQKVRFSKTLSPTEVAHVNAMGVLTPATGVARANYKVPQRVGVLKSSVTLNEEAFKNWLCTVYGSYVYTDINTGKPVVFTGQATIGTPLGASPALDAREKDIQDMVTNL